MIFRKAKKPLAVDIGSSQIKALGLDGDASAPRVTSLAIETLPTDAIVGGEVMDYHLVVDALRGLRERVAGKGRPVATAVSGRDVIVKRIKMDRMREQEARQVIRWEAEQHVPFDMDSVNLDFEILDPEADGLQMEVLLVAAKRDLIESRMRMFSEAGFDVGVIDLEAFAVETAFEHGYDHSEYGAFCLVNVGREVTNLNLVENGRPLLTRDLPVGERRFVESLVRELGISSEEAAERLRARDPGPDDRKALAEAIESLVTPVERARSFMAAAEGGTARLDEVVLSGGGATLPGLREAIAERLQTEVTLMDPLRGLQVSPEDQLTIEQHGGSGIMAVAAGLALRGKE
ncbi:MAG TPA: type IV pilus assembly protein PilM [Gemmatimonadota bacterium]|nr:type IV pilus assembly protein PilM [Gemmatimonadota bacterium]